MTWWLQIKIRAFENINKLITVIVGSATLAMVGTIVAEFIAADAGIGYSIRIALFQSDLAKILVALFLIGVCTSLYLVLLEWIGHLIQKRWEIPEGG
jgi:NitT/TauT family transport system permease protein